MEMIFGGQAMGRSEAMGGEEVLVGGDEQRWWLARLLWVEVMVRVTVGEDGAVGDQHWGKSCPCSFLLFLFSFFQLVYSNFSPMHAGGG